MARVNIQTTEERMEEAESITAIKEANLKLNKLKRIHNKKYGKRMDFKIIYVIIGMAFAVLVNIILKYS